MALAAPKIDLREAGRIDRSLVELGNLELRVGILGPGASALEEGSSLTLAELGLIHEYGTSEIPERSFLRRTFIARRTDLAALKVQVFKRILMRELTPRAGLEAIGMQMVAWVQIAIVAGIAPALAPSTIAAKGSSTPLIDDAQLIRSITFEVREKGAAAA